MDVEPEQAPRLRKDAERNLARILTAAREGFRDRGVGATLNDIAHHAGVGVGPGTSGVGWSVRTRVPSRSRWC